MKNIIKDKRAQGFTIIEVMIVLAIAGLILAIVFFAVPQLQRNARDNQRENVATRIKAELDTYHSNNQGKYPWTGGSTSYAACATGSGGATLTCQDFMYRYIYNSTTSPVVNINDPTTGTAATVYMGWDQAGGNEATGRTWGPGRIYVSVGNSCVGDQPGATGGQAGSNTAQKFAVAIALDRTNTWYCVDNG